MERFFYKIINPFRSFYWRIFKPKTFGVKIFIEYDGKFLFIRNSYGVGHWTLPGGGVKRKEAPKDCAKRETKEEVGIVLQDLIYLGKYLSTRQYKLDTVYCFYSKTNAANFNIDEDEVAEAKWFSLSEIPQFKSAAVEEALNLYKKLNM